MQKKLKVPRAKLSILVQENNYSKSRYFLFNIFKNILIGMVSVFNYVSFIVDAFTDKLAGSHYCFLLAVEGGVGLQNSNLQTI